MLERIQEILSDVESKVFFMTGDVLSAETSEFLERTNTPYLTKPFHADRLVAETDRILIAAQAE